MPVTEMSVMVFLAVTITLFGEIKKTAPEGAVSFHH